MSPAAAGLFILISCILIEILIKVSLRLRHRPYQVVRCQRIVQRLTSRADLAVHQRDRILGACTQQIQPAMTFQRQLQPSLLQDGGSYICLRRSSSSRQVDTRPDLVDQRDRVGSIAGLVQRLSLQQDDIGESEQYLIIRAVAAARVLPFIGNKARDP